jgi:antitoxin (DNA-binding transcriptional repressor) of toxin-antitoxin stability system
MTRVEVEQFRDRMDEYLQHVALGDPVILVRDGVAIAELHGPAPRALPLAQRPIGLARGLGTIPPTFFDPLPDDLAALFGGEEPPAETP